MPPPGKTRSLEWRLILRLSLLYLVAIVLAVVAYAAISLANHEVENGERFLALTPRIAASVTREAGGSLKLRLAPDLQRQLGAISDFELAVTELGGGHLVEGSSAGLADRLGPMTPALTRAEFSLETGGRLRRGVFSNEPGAGTTLRVAVIYGQPTLADTLIWVVGEIGEEVLPVMLPSMLLSLLIGIATVRSALAPIKRLSAELGAIGPNRVDVSLAEDGVPLEVLPMVRAINHALARLDGAMEQQRRMTANAAHELRTPLAILRARIEGMDGGPARAARERDVARVIRLVDQLMAVARLEAGQVVVDGEVDLVRVARETLAACAPLALARGRGVELTAPGRAVEVPGNALALGDALMNLVDNALRFTKATSADNRFIPASAAR